MPMRQRYIRFLTLITTGAGMTKCTAPSVAGMRCYENLKMCYFVR
jgi:hypothetical protein